MPARRFAADPARIARGDGFDQYRFLPSHLPCKDLVGDLCLQVDQALDALISLSGGNRMIGIISHVEELKSRIDRQIVVERTKNGSRIRSGGLEG